MCLDVCVLITICVCVCCCLCRPLKVPQVQEVVKYVNVERVVEEIVEVPQIEYEEEVIQRHVPTRAEIIPKYVEVPEVRRRQVLQLRKKAAFRKCVTTEKLGRI